MFPPNCDVLQPFNSVKQLNLPLPYHALVDLSHWQILFQASLRVAFSLSSFLSCLIILSLPSATRHGSLFVPFRGMSFDTFGLQRACGCRMNEYQGNIVLVCVGCGVGGHSVLRHLYCFFNLDIREWNTN